MGYFDGKVAIITGAARGLGFDYAAFFLQDGARVVLGDITCAAVHEATARLQASGRALGICLDVTDVVSTQAMAGHVMKTFGHADILVNNAAIWGDLQRSPLLETAPEYWDHVMATNVKGALLCCRALVPLMRQRAWGRIINISSGGAYKPGGVYSVGKLALNQLTYSLAHEVADAGITCNGIAPGPVYTEASQRHYAAEAFEQLVQQGMIKRAGTSRDMYGCMRYLCSEDAAWVTGQTLYVNGGSMSRF
jgi:3-oxoacyl-[acyl-carrier protein] reductase